MNYQVVNPSRGSARKGNALLQGLAVCGICGCRMHINYPASAAKSHRYDCDAMQKRCEKRTCMSLQGTVIDEAVTQAFFEAIRPAQINALEVLLAEQDREHQLLTRQWEERLKRIQYEIQLAQRQYYNVDPENRLVAAELEHRWEQKLQDYQQVQSDYQLFRIKHSPHELSPALREQFAHISETLPGLWPRLPNEHKKELLKSLISQVILKRIRPDQLEIRIVWVSGHCSLKQAHPPIHRMEDVSRYKEMVARIHDLWEDGLSDNNIAELMTEEGFRTARTNYMTADQVTRIREKQGWFSRFIKMRRKEEIDGYLTVKGLAKKVGISRNLLYRWIMAGIVDEKYMRRDPQGNFRMIQNAPELIEQLQQKKSASHVYKKDV